jgi:hypothetical protein
MEKLVAYMRVPNMRDTLSRAIRYYGPRTDRILRGIYFVWSILGYFLVTEPLEQSSKILMACVFKM